ncbi:MAG: hypothetical protein E2P04_07155 [Acidobacteria bacterium]|nr:MAG: hypothetical protein E2P04_07155 [Acidobacteriota bacterium]
MIWKYRQVNTLPRLAWCLHVRRDDPEVTVLHGPWVEIRHDGFVEGAWDGSFTEFDFDQATFFTGSGARRTDTGIVVVTASNSLEAVFVARRDNSLLASNSLVFLLDQLDDAPQPAYPLYALQFRRFHRGSGKQGRRLMTTRGGVRIDGYFLHNLRIGTDLCVEVVEQNKPPTFCDFAGYRELLQQSVTRLVDNARSPQRRRSYAPITTLSQGYDSAAVSCLAARAGCRDSLSFYSQQGGRRLDSGAEIAAHLGLGSLELPRDAYRSAPGIADAEFEACPDGVGVVWLGVEEHLRARLLFVGDFGDNMWTRGRRSSCHVTSFMTCKEFRLRTGFLVAAPAYFAMHAIPTVRTIANSDEMVPWRVDSRYDRPIPRRIIEESGVPGTAIARNKQAHGHIWSPDARSMTDGGRRDYQAYLRHLEVHAGKRQLSRSRLQHRLARASLSARRGLRKRLKRLRRYFPDLAVYRVPRVRDWEYCFLFQWGLERTRERYRIQASAATEVASAAASAGIPTRAIAAAPPR